LRSGSGYRIYEISDLERVRFIRNCQGLGFTLREIQQLIHLHSGLSRSRRAVAMKPVPVLEIIELANERMLVIDEKIRALNSMRDELITLVNTLANTSPAVCLASRQKNQRQEK
jgi:DNA-binding transcriptional MerR regulator